LRGRKTHPALLAVLAVLAMLAVCFETRSRETRLHEDKPNRLDTRAEIHKNSARNEAANGDRGSVPFRFGKDS
jgi:hypothetical protein